MSGAVLFTVITIAILLVVGVFMSPWFLIPAVVVGVFFLISGPIMAGLRSSGGDRAGSGTPSTQDATYDPVSTPGQRSV
jgi:hypothetical protein